VGATTIYKVYTKNTAPTNGKARKKRKEKEKT
jgi:hypothetical protein